MSFSTRRIARVLALLSSVFASAQAFPDLDGRLDQIFEIYELEPKTCGATGADKSLAQIGKLLFNTFELSGDRDTSCATCHLDEHGSTDGLPMSIGVGGTSEGFARYKAGSGTVVARNALSLIGRAKQEFTAYFWDGKVQLIDGEIVTRFGKDLPPGFTSPLAAAAILPLLERDEFLGKRTLFSSNELRRSVETTYFREKYDRFERALQTRLIESETPDSTELRKLVKRGGVPVQEVDLVFIGNALATFISTKFVCEESAFDRYLMGDRSSLNEDQKQGAVVFFGRGRCAACHSGTLFSDFDFHSIGVPQGAYGVHTRRRDMGRAGVTFREEDVGRFRTPTLIGVSDSSPYGHSGVFPDLKSVVEHHINPLEVYFQNRSLYDADRPRIGGLLSRRHPLLATIELSNEDIDLLVSFLEAL